MNPFKIHGHEFTEDDGSCANCGQEYRDFLKNGGGCILTGPQFTIPSGTPSQIRNALGLPEPVDPTANTFPPDPEKCECATWAREDLADPGHHPHCPWRPIPLARADLLALSLTLNGFAIIERPDKLEPVGIDYDGTVKPIDKL